MFYVRIRKKKKKKKWADRMAIRGVEEAIEEKKVVVVV